MLEAERYWKIVDLAPDAIISIDIHQNIVLFNRGAEEIYGYQRSEVLGRPVVVLMPERFRDPHTQDVDNFDTEEVEIRHMNERGHIIGQRKNGEEFPARGAIIKTGDGPETNYTLILRDISAYEKIRQELRSRINELESSNFDLRQEKQQLARTEGLLDQLLGQSHSYRRRPKR